MTSQFHVVFTRYRNGKREQTGPQFFQADDFFAAVEHATGMLQGLRLADVMGYEYGIAEVRHYGLGGTWPQSGGWPEKEEEDAESDAA